MPGERGSWTAGPRAAQERGAADLQAGRFHWRVSRPPVEPLQRPGDTCYSVKDPSVVYYQGRWHLFCPIRGKQRSHQIEYLTFPDWDHTAQADRHVLAVHDGFFCAPQVFYFRPHAKWHLICQASDDAWDPKYGAAYATTDHLADGVFSLAAPSNAHGDRRRCA